MSNSPKSAPAMPSIATAANMKRYSSCVGAVKNISKSSPEVVATSIVIELMNATVSSRKFTLLIVPFSTRSAFIANEREHSCSLQLVGDALGNELGSDDGGALKLGISVG